MNAPAKTAQTKNIAPKILSRRTLIVVKRDQTAATSRIVWSHEIPLLEAIFGEGNVLVQETDALDEGYSAKPSPDLLPYNKKQDLVLPPSQTLGLEFVFIGNARAEYERLAAHYGKHPTIDQSWVENIFDRFQAGQFAALVGKPELEDLPPAQLRQLVEAYGWLPIVAHDSPPAEKEDARKKQLELRTMERDKLIKIAEELAVEFG